MADKACHVVGSTTQVGLTQALGSSVMDTRKFHEDLASLVDALCELRALGSLRELLPHYPMHMGLTDEWAGLASALKTVRVQHRKELPARETEMVVSLQHVAESALGGQR